MFKIRSFIIGCFCFITALAFRASGDPLAGGRTPHAQLLQELVDQYDQANLNAVEKFKTVIAGDNQQWPAPPGNRPPPPRECDPEYGGGSPGSCIQAVCSQLSSFECDSREKLLEITRLCRNVRGSCVRMVCSKVGTFGCNERSDFTEVTQICRGLYDTSCIDSVCSRLPRWDCNELSELRQIADQCR